MWRSSSVPITQKDLSSSRSAGWSNERSHGSDDAGVSPKIGRISTERRSHFCASLQSGSCSENYAIPRDLSGQTLRNCIYFGHPSGGGTPPREAPIEQIENKIKRGSRIEARGHHRLVLDSRNLSQPVVSCLLPARS